MPSAPRSPHRSAPRVSPLKDAVLAFLRRTADEQGLVRLTREQIAIGCGYVTAVKRWDDKRKARMREIIRLLRVEGSIRQIAPPDSPGEPETLQIKSARGWQRPASSPGALLGEPDHVAIYDEHESSRRPPLKASQAASPRDLRLEEFDSRSARWPSDRRRLWRAIWRGVLGLADKTGDFTGERDLIAEQASNLLGQSVSPQAVSACLRWAIAVRFVDPVTDREPAGYRLRIPARES